MFRRAFVSRIMPPDVVEKLGMQHVKGMLLHGPPGTGKTLMARKIGSMLNGREVSTGKPLGKKKKNLRASFQSRRPIKAFSFPFLFSLRHSSFLFFSFFWFVHSCSLKL